MKKKSQAKWLTFSGLIALFLLTLLPLSLITVHFLLDIAPELMEYILPKDIISHLKVNGTSPQNGLLLQNGSPLPIDNNAVSTTWSWQKMLPVIGLEFVLIYFFRVMLSHYHSIQTQITQLELRQSLCQFIQDYADYAKEIKASDKDALEKFENLIFSSILSNPDKVPGTFDGIDGLTSLLKEIKGSK